MRRPLKVLGAAIVVILAGSVGYAGGAQQAPVEIRTITNTEKVEVESVPQSCHNALRQARAGFKNTDEFVEIMGDFLVAVDRLDVAGVERQADRLDRLSVDIPLMAILFRGSAAECESADK